ncbi:uracil-DNA glycosylase family protein, partial [Pseudomonas sp. RA_35y_Pfl2_P32]|uniref:uracil-DNA glycosylase family protein n=1 Tax=Pseudomonas sp. RA_35y_Pfl2_P32 TaxID=3088705 RepID=UPI0030DAE61D
MKVCTIGYEATTMADFLAALTGAGVERVIDVRALPLSRRPGFSKTSLAASLAEAGIDRAGVYVTNAVKHFKFEQRGKRRIHMKPDAGEISACRWWIEQERLLVRPKVTVALGATAARSLLGRVVTIRKERGRALALPDGGEAWITVHPSYLLRLPDRDAAALEYA